MAITQPERMNLRAGPGTQYAVAAPLPALPLRFWLSPQDGSGSRFASETEEPAWIFGSLVNLTGPTDGLAKCDGKTNCRRRLRPHPPRSSRRCKPQPQPTQSPPPSGAGFFGYGVQAHLLGGGAGAALNAVNDLGFNWIKQQVEWRLFQPQPGAIGFGELGGIVSEANNRASTCSSASSTPEWARAGL